MSYKNYKVELGSPEVCCAKRLVFYPDVGATSETAIAEALGLSLAGKTVVELVFQTVHLIVDATSGATVQEILATYHSSLDAEAAVEAEAAVKAAGLTSEKPRKKQYLLRVGSAPMYGVSKSEYRIASIQCGLNGIDLKEFSCASTELPIRGIIRDEPEFVLPTVKAMDSFPPHCNPFHYDLGRMGREVSGAWVAMYTDHSGLKQDHNKTDAERASDEPVYNDDPKEILFVNTKTGQRFKIDFTVEPKVCAPLLNTYGEDTSEEFKRNCG